MGDVINMDTTHWAPDQVARWLTKQVETETVRRVYCIVEYEPDEDDDGVDFEQMWSKSTRESLLYIITYAYRKTVKRYFR